MQGQSGYTRFKQERFGPVLAQSLRISKNEKIAKFAYYHVDLNAGSGFNEEVRVPGSPLNFLDAVNRQNRPNYYAFFVDNREEAISELTLRLESRPDLDRIAIFEGDNSEILPVVSEFVISREPNPRFAVGSILIDPNGYHKGVPWLALRTLCEKYPRFDVFLNLNVRSYQLERPHIQGRHKGWERYELQPPSGFALQFNRRYWMITPICHQGGSRWIQCVGRSMETAKAGYESLGFYDHRSDKGCRIIAELEETIAETQTDQFPLLSHL